MEHADAKQKRLLGDMELNKKKFDNEIQKLDENHNKVLCKEIYSINKFSINP